MVYLEKSAADNGYGVDCRPRIIFSSDEAGTWSEPVEICTLEESVYLVVNNDRLIQLRNGRLLLPAAQHDLTGGVFGNGSIRFFTSDDGGRSWQLNPQMLTPDGSMPKYGFMEPGVIEIAAGSLMCFIRTAAGCHYKSVSTDNGRSWSEAEPMPEFPAPSSPMSIKCDPETGKLYAIWNDYAPERSVAFTDKRWARTPLVMAESSDGGVSWENHRILENAPDHGYCYIAMYFNGRKLHLGYCCGGEPHCVDNLQETKVRAIDL